MTPRVLILLTEEKAPRPVEWKPREESEPCRVDSVTRARMVLEHPECSGGAAA
jgi:hypothetical protein